MLTIAPIINQAHITNYFTAHQVEKSSHADTWFFFKRNTYFHLLWKEKKLFDWSSNLENNTKSLETSCVTTTKKAVSPSTRRASEDASSLHWADLSHTLSAWGLSSQLMLPLCWEILAETDICRLYSELKTEKSRNNFFGGMEVTLSSTSYNWKLFCYVWTHGAKAWFVRSAYSSVYLECWN